MLLSFGKGHLCSVCLQEVCKLAHRHFHYTFLEKNCRCVVSKINELRKLLCLSVAFGVILPHQWLDSCFQKVIYSLGSDIGLMLGKKLYNELLTVLGNMYTY